MSSFWKIIYSVIFSILGYFEPIKDIVHMMMFFFMLDVFYGWRADKKLTGAHFKTSLVWATTIPRMLASTIILICTYLLDEVTGQEYVSVYAISGYIISGLLLISICKNMYIVTNWTVIPVLGKFFKSKVENATGTKLEEGV